MISIEVLLILIWLHFVADFILQTDNMALNKSTNNKWLIIHILVYILPFCFFGWVFVVVNGVAHFVTDFITSRATAWFHKRETRYWFFVVIGLDQAIHITTLIVTYLKIKNYIL